MEINERLRKIIMEELMVNEDEVQPNAKFFDDLGADEINMAKIHRLVEDEFLIEIEDNEEDALHTVGDLISLVERKLKENEG
ncbi:acyl carrier protein [Chryseobacterium sediminis]|uniref:acyl carrier protein n=1 Tax=Chryseobacterium sediminis TaxID=1679494 RepID=UPI0028635D0B|nr:acyl carrier protein [Chryseobacterium sediminis]MDR6464567.1 acyl carrier protein [Chryseobacterium sediminis]